jgi:shikimate dehydrogenase
MVSIAGSTQLLGVMGYPIEHSLSPAMHNAALSARAERLGSPVVDYVYLPLKVDPNALGQAVRGLAATGWRGFNVTIPHKQSIIDHLNHISPLAIAVGAVNTVWRQDQEWFGTNTDVQGFLAPLIQQRPDWCSASAYILGTGGAARAVIAACAQLQCQVHVFGRDRAKLESLQYSFAEDLAAIQIHDWAELTDQLSMCDLLINTTPIGMYPHIKASPLTESQITQLPSLAVVYDLIYTPRPTQLLLLARQRGCKVLDGLEMLVQQGAAAFEIWVGERPDLGAMRQAALSQLDLKH